MTTDSRQLFSLVINKQQFKQEAWQEAEGVVMVVGVVTRLTLKNPERQSILQPQKID